ALDDLAHRLHGGRTAEALDGDGGLGRAQNLIDGGRAKLLVHGRLHSIRACSRGIGVQPSLSAHAPTAQYPSRKGLTPARPQPASRTRMSRPRLATSSATGSSAASRVW